MASITEQTRAPWKMEICAYLAIIPSLYGMILIYMYMHVTDDMPGFTEHMWQVIIKGSGSNSLGISNYTETVATPVLREEIHLQNSGGRRVRMCSQTERLEQVDKSCEQYWRNMTWKVKTPAPLTLVDTRHRLVIGWVSKGGCTALKALLMEASGYDPARFEHGHSHMFVHNWGLMRTLGIHPLKDYLYNKTASQHILAEFFRVALLRHPFERLVSVYRGKVVSKDTDIPQFAANILKMFYPDLFKRNKTLSGMLRPQAVLGSPSFNQFLTWIATAKTKNNHWNSIVESMHPCAIKWNALMRLETMQHDGVILLDRLKPDVTYNNISVRHSHQHQPISDHEWKLLPEYKDVSDDVIRYFLDLYRVDMDMFGYQWDTTNLTASCSINTNRGLCC